MGQSINRPLLLTPRPRMVHTKRVEIAPPPMFTAPNGTTFKATAAQRWLLTGKGCQPGRPAMKAAYWILRDLGYAARPDRLMRFF